MTDADAGELLLDHFRSPYHRGRLERPTCAAAERNPLCGDEVRLELLVDAGRVERAYFDGRGCLVSQAAASILCEFAEGRPVAELHALAPGEVLRLIGVPLTPRRQACALLGLLALRAALPLPVE